MKRIKPWEMTPDDALVRSGTAYAMASSAQLAAYLPRGGRVLLDLSRMRGSLQAQWYNPRGGSFGESFGVDGGRTHEFKAPDENDWGLLLQRRP
jgi:Putative collagen-binding domain of a collagenase